MPRGSTTSPTLMRERRQRKVLACADGDNILASGDMGAAEVASCPTFSSNTLQRDEQLARMGRQQRRGGEQPAVDN